MQWNYAFPPLNFYSDNYIYGSLVHALGNIAQKKSYILSSFITFI